MPLNRMIQKLKLRKNSSEFSECWIYLVFLNYKTNSQIIIIELISLAKKTISWTLNFVENIFDWLLFKFVKVLLKLEFVVWFIYEIQENLYPMKYYGFTVYLFRMIPNCKLRILTSVLWNLSLSILFNIG